MLTDPATRANRLTYDDDLFLRMRRVLGIPLVNQTVWRFPEPLDSARLAELHRRLGRGRLGRVVQGPRVPGARPRWVRSGVTSPLVVDDEPVSASAVLAWADAAAGSLPGSGLDLDPVAGPGWALRAASTSDGGSVLSYLTSHAVADGGAHLGAVVEAVRGADGPRLPVDNPGLLQSTLGDDLRDAAHQVRRASRGLLDAARARGPRPLVDAQQSTDTAPRDPAPGDEEAYAVPTVVVDCPADAWEAAARRHGGTANTLLIALSVEVLLATGRAEPGRPVRTAIPVSLRHEGDLRSNATSGVSVSVPTTVVGGVGRVTDLAALRSATRAELAARADGTRFDPLEPLKPLLQLLPDRAVARLARDNSAPLCLCSNLGGLEKDYAAPLGVDPASVLMRSLTQGATRGMLRRARGGLSTWWSRHGDLATMSLVCLDPDLPAATLRPALLAAFERWEIPAVAW